MNEKVKSAKETKGIANYLCYITQRIIYLQFFTDDINTSIELKYCKELQQRIKEWARTHRICYQYIRGKISVDECVQYMGVSKRVFFYMMAKQKAGFIEFIQKTENELEKKYPFTPSKEYFTED